VYNPKEKVANFCQHEYGRAILNGYNTIDPFHCYYGEDVNPDEYLGYAKRFLQQMEPNQLSEEMAIELTRNAFFTSQDIPDADIRSIGTAIYKNIKNS